MVVVLQELDNYIILISRSFTMYYVYPFLSYVCFFCIFFTIFHLFFAVSLTYFKFI